MVWNRRRTHREQVNESGPTTTDTKLPAIDHALQSLAVSRPHAESHRTSRRERKWRERTVYLSNKAGEGRLRSGHRLRRDVSERAVRGDRTVSAVMCGKGGGGNPAAVSVNVGTQMSRWSCSWLSC